MRLIDGSGERFRGGGDEFALGLLSGEVAGVGAFVLAGDFEGALFNGFAVDGSRKRSLVS